MRAIKARTKLTTKELFDYLQTVKGTIGKIKVVIGNRESFYYMAASDAPFQLTYS